MKNRFLQIFLLASLCLFQPGAMAEDIDVFAAPAEASSANAPNMLLVMDNAGSFNGNAAGSTCIIDGVATSLSGKSGGIEQCALYTVINNQTVSATATVNIGIMVYNGPSTVDYKGVSCRSGAVGGCLVYPLTGLTSVTKPILLAWIKSWESSGHVIQASSEATGATMQEAWAYFAGRTGLSGVNYASIQPATGCLRNFVVFIGNSYTTSGSPSDSTGNKGPLDALNGTNPTALMNAYPAATTVQKALIPATGNSLTTSCGVLNFPNTHENSGFYADEWARYMAANNITTYSIGLLDLTKCKSEYAWLLRSMASSGGGKYFETTDYNTLKVAVETVFSEVQSVNSVFASVSLPVSVNTQGTYLNQVFIGMFRPDPDSLPRWFGNLKQYKLGYAGGILQLLDADDSAAISTGGSDFIAECARSFWTPLATAAGDGYWNNISVPNCLSYPAQSNSPDGNLVEKGGQGYKLRGITPSTRTVYTCPATLSSCTSLTSFDTANAAITQAALDAASVAPKNTLINWARGQNTQSETGTLNGTALSTSDMRPSSHGDVVHSRPAAINFGTDAVPRVVVFYGANDGMLRAVNGNRTASITGVTVGASTNQTITAGSELWAFMPPEFYGSIKRNYDNSAKIGTPYVTGTAKSYGMDGSIGTYQTSANSNAWIYASMRRGGRAIYAFNVNATTLAVSLKWKRGCGDSGTSNCTNDGNGDFRDIGQTWATPKAFKAGGYGSGASPMLVLGGGYDATCEDAASYSCASTTGNRIYIMNADTGVLLKTFTTTRSVVGDVTMVSDANGLATYGYAADLGGNVYRISGATATAPLGTTEPQDWTITKIAALGCGVTATTAAATTPTCSSPPNRKFMYGPDVVMEGGSYLLMIGSGDREKPLNLTNATQNYFFMIKDQPTVSGYQNGSCSGISGSLCLKDLLPVTSGATPSSSDLNGKKGWYLALNANEQVVTSSIAVYGTVYFSTNQPKVADGTCKGNLGTTRAYQIAYSNAGNPVTGQTTDALYTTLAAGGLPPSPVAGQVKLDSGVTVPFVLGCNSALQACGVTPPPGVGTPPKVRSYWYIQK